MGLGIRMQALTSLEIVEMVDSDVKRRKRLIPTSLPSILLFSGCLSKLWSRHRKGIHLYGLLMNSRVLKLVPGPKTMLFAVYYERWRTDSSADSGLVSCTSRDETYQTRGGRA